MFIVTKAGPLFTPSGVKCKPTSLHLELLTEFVPPRVSVTINQELLTEFLAARFRTSKPCPTPARRFVLALLSLQTMS